METPHRAPSPPCRVLLINGPPRSGKDTVGDLLVEAFRNVDLVEAELFKFARYLKDAARALYPDIQCWETDKDTPQPGLFGRTKREVLINLSENHFKPLYGEQFFGERLLARIEWLLGMGRVPMLAVVTDSGFKVEDPPLIEHFGAENVALLRVHRHGCSYASDSRDYLEFPEHPNLIERDISNDSTLDDLRRRVFGLVQGPDIDPILHYFLRGQS